MKNETNPASDQQPETKFPYRCSPTGYFDVAPLLYTLTEFTSPDDMARALDGMTYDLTRFYIDHEGEHSDASRYIHYLRQLRDDLLQGMRAFTFSETLSDKWKAEAKALRPGQSDQAA